MTQERTRSARGGRAGPAWPEYSHGEPDRERGADGESPRKRLDPQMLVAALALIAAVVLVVLAF
jgi:hypothetical protein